ncbi:two-component sensor histidine kinase [Acrocarpospora corrugata]|uniref:histidine kinase n=1 Tax=Acrocarpospora corrugata TaxID=35763 RepID=A0A5M3W0Y5_9ACTN|nr:HAMP domain-containing sensor histidine kinase [Acrocarpospora corrugata]GES02695.1 two-component sensor histidine kinase [Acrocarpospora corrugata]
MTALRVRLTLLYTALFLVSGAAVVAIVYGLVAALPKDGAIRVEHPMDFLAYCRQAIRAANPDLERKCEAAFRQGVVFGGERETTLAALLQYGGLALAVATVFAAAAGWIVASRVLRPIEAAHAAQRRFIANAAHELRTPLTVMRTAVDVVLGKPAPTNAELTGMGREVAQAVQQAEVMIDGLLTLARTARPPTREDLDLATLAEDVIDAAGSPVHADLGEAPTSGDRVTLERLVANLVDNAVRYNVPGGEVWVSTERHEGRATLTVANTGPVIDAAVVPGLFEPFRRLRDRTSADGHGLGLAIVAQITAAHDGTLSAVPRPGGGLTVTVALPGR